jgi:hypothetical protein
MRTLLMLTFLFNSHPPNAKEDFKVNFLVGFGVSRPQTPLAGPAESSPDPQQEDDLRNDLSWDQLYAPFETSTIFCSAYPAYRK